MKKTLLLFSILLNTAAAFAQTEISRDANGNKILKGFISKQQLATDTAFAWFIKNGEGFTPDASALQTLRTKKDSVNFLVFGGTWCGDTKHILPQFFKLTDAAGVSPERITLLGVDHDKKTIEHLSEAFGITNVPTIIVLKKGKEVGRIVEYGTIGMVDKELGQIISAH